MKRNALNAPTGEQRIKEQKNKTASSNAAREVRDSSSATATEPIRTRLSGEGNAVLIAIVTETIIPVKAVE